MLNHTPLTLYNRVPGTEMYLRTVIPAAQWENRKAANVLASGGNLAVDQAWVYIPAGTSGYLPPKAWGALVDKSSTWTLQTGDVVVKGVVADELTGSFTLTALRAKYDDVLAITSVDAMDYGSARLNHWQVGAK